MGKKKIVIAGGGFAGLSAVQEFLRQKEIRAEYEIILIDEKAHSEFLPLIPDIVAGWLRPESVRVSFRTVAKKYACTFIQASIRNIDLRGRRIELDERTITYDYLIIGTGGKPNFFGNVTLREQCATLNTVDDALRIRRWLSQRAVPKTPVNVVIIGGGYTGIETATNSHYCIEQREAEPYLWLVEKQPEILSMVPGWLRDYVEQELPKLGITVLTNDSLESVDGGTVRFASGKQIDDCLCIWSAGITLPSCLQTVPGTRKRGRIAVDTFLSLSDAGFPQVFVAGDAAAFTDTRTNEPLRMAVMFAQAQGTAAARNICRSIYKKSWKPFRPHDLGYLIPLTYRKGPGVVLGRKTGPVTGYFLHYLMCFYRSDGGNRKRLLHDLLVYRLLRRSVPPSE